MRAETDLASWSIVRCRSSSAMQRRVRRLFKQSRHQWLKLLLAEKNYHALGISVRCKVHVSTGCVEDP